MKVKSESKSEASKSQSQVTQWLIDDLMMQVKDLSENVTTEEWSLLMNGVMKVHYEMCEQDEEKIINNG